MTKDNCQKKNCPGVKKTVKLVIGVSLLIAGIAAVILWWPELIGVAKGCIGLFLIGLGAIAIIISK